MKLYASGTLNICLILSFLEPDKRKSDISKSSEESFMKETASLEKGKASGEAMFPLFSLNQRILVSEAPESPWQELIPARAWFKTSKLRPRHLQKIRETTTRLRSNTKEPILTWVQNEFRLEWNPG